MFQFPLFPSYKTSSQTFCPLSKINQLQSVFSFISALWIELCFCVPLLFTFLSISLTCGCLFPHRCWKRSRRAPRVPWRVSTSEGRLNPSPITLQPTPPCRDCRDWEWLPEQGGFTGQPPGSWHWSYSVKYFSPCPSFPLILPFLF